MGKTNYNKMANKPKEDVMPAFVETTSLDETPVVEEVVAPEAEAVVEEVAVENEVKIGVVVDCMKLNVRNNPSMMAEIALTIDKGTEVEILDECDDFYFVRKDNTTEGFSGWCMKKYISVK